MYVICCDLEGCFVPEIWINVAEKTRIEKLRITTRDEPNYDKLMNMRIDILKENNLKLKDIKDIISTIDPLEGAKDFLDWLKTKAPVIILSDTFVEFADPLMEKLDRPTLFCNSLIIGDDNFIKGYQLRQHDGKKKAVQALQNLGYQIIAMGDSYNDTTMLKEAEVGILFNPPQNVIDKFPEFPVAKNYEELKQLFNKYF